MSDDEVRVTKTHSDTLTISVHRSGATSMIGISYSEAKQLVEDLHGELLRESARRDPVIQGLLERIADALDVPVEVLDIGFEDTE